MALLTIQENINNGLICTYLSANKKANGALFPNVLPTTSAVTIAIVTQALRWQYDGDPTDSNLRLVANYLYWLTGAFNLQSKYIMQGSGGGAVIPSGSVGYAYFVINAVISAQSTTYQNNDLILGKDLGYAILNDQTFSETQDFTFDPTTGMVTFLTMTLFSGDRLILPFNKKLP